MGVDEWLLHEGDEDPRKGPQRVSDAQWLLSGHNVFGRVFYRGPIDGVFGPKTAEAARLAKYQLGYRDSAVEPTYGPRLRAYLLGNATLTPVMTNRAKSRAVKFVWPTNPHGRLIGFPGQGTHSYRYPPNNWESDYAWDIAVPVGSKALATADGVIGPSFGSLGRGGRFAGLRLHLETDDNEFYYAHLSHFTAGIAPGVRVEQGEVLGLTGSANGVAHLHFGVEHLLPLADFK